MRGVHLGTTSAHGKTPAYKVASYFMTPDWSDAKMKRPDWGASQIMRFLLCRSTSAGILSNPCPWGIGHRLRLLLGLTDDDGFHRCVSVSASALPGRGHERGDNPDYLVPMLTVSGSVLPPSMTTWEPVR